MEDNWTLDPWRFVEGTYLEDFYDQSEAGFFHVTTQAGAIDRQRVLLSRADLLKSGSAHQGLGGGRPDAISFGISGGQARKIFSAMRTVKRAMNAELPLIEYLMEILGWTGFPDDWDDGVDGETLMEANGSLLASLGFLPGMVRRKQRRELDTASGWNSLFNTHEDFLKEQFSTPEDLYGLVQSIEDGLYPYAKEIFQNEERSACLPLILFAANYNSFAQVKIDEIGIVQCAVREDAQAFDLVMEECELQFLSRDVRVVQTRVEERGAVKIQ